MEFLSGFRPLLYTITIITILLRRGFDAVSFRRSFIPTNPHSWLDRQTRKGSQRLSTSTPYDSLTHYDTSLTISKCLALVPAARSTQTEHAVASREIANVRARARANLSARAVLHAHHALKRATKTLVNAQTKQLAAGPTARGAAAADNWPIPSY